MSYLRNRNDSEFDETPATGGHPKPPAAAIDNNPNLYSRYRDNVANDGLRRSSEGIPAISADDFRLLRECNRESFYMRCLPLSVGICSLMYFLAAKKNMRPKTLHILSGCFGGWFLGKMSYRRTCEDRLINSGSHSPFVTAMRRRRGIQFDDTVLTADGQTVMADEQPGGGDQFWDPQSKDQFGYNPNEFADYKDSDFGGGNSGRQDSEDTKTYTTYDDLRAQNRASSQRPQQPKPYNA